MIVAIPTPVSSGSNLSTLPILPSTSSLTKRRREASEKRHELLVNAYENELRDGPSSPIRPSMWSLPKYDPLSLTCHSINGYETHPADDETARPPPSSRIAEERTLPDVSVRRKLMVRKALPIESGSTRISVSIVGQSAVRFGFELMCFDRLLTLELLSVITPLLQFSALTALMSRSTNFVARALA